MTANVVCGVCGGNGGGGDDVSDGDGDGDAASEVSSVSISIDGSFLMATLSTLVAGVWEVTVDELDSLPAASGPSIDLTAMIINTKNLKKNKIQNQ